MLLKFTQLIVLTLTLFLSSAYAMQIAITLDDLPENGLLTTGITRVQVADKIMNTLQKHHIQGVYGFVNGKPLISDPEKFTILKNWIASGQLLANHGYSHLDLAKTSVDEYLLDLEKNEPILSTFMGEQNFHFYRYPYLSEGDIK
ncbi:polysaccharide deacetylase family protein [Legionella santicrucis]|nr:polysaccharide deacetylase family protein [Legionella santicrucis]